MEVLVRDLPPTYTIHAVIHFTPLTLSIGFLIGVIGASIIGFLPFVIVCAVVWIVYANV